MPERFDMRSIVEGGRARVKITGEVDLFTAPELKGTLRDLIADGATDLTVDLRAATFLDSTGISALFGAYRLPPARRGGAGRARGRPRGGALTVLADDPRITQPLELTGLTEFVSLVA